MIDWDNPVHTTKNTKTYQMESFKKNPHILIGDTLQLDADKKDYERLVFDKTIRKAKIGKVKLETIKTVNKGTGEDDVISTDTEITIAIASTEEIVDTYLNNKIYPGQIKKEMDLGCDSASFIIDCDGRYCDILTGGDGTYGMAWIMKEGYGVIIYLFIDSEITPYNEIESAIKYIFNLREE